MIVKDAVAHDRQVRRKLSRAKYGTHVGLTEGRVHALEHGRKVKPGEIELLTPFIGDLLDAELVAATTDEATTPGTTRQDTGQQDASDFERTTLGMEYMRVMQRLGTRMPPFPWPSQFRLETAPPIEFDAIRDWIKNVAGWLDEQEGVVSEPAVDLSTEFDTTVPDELDEPLTVYPVDDVDDVEWEEIPDASLVVGGDDEAPVPMAEVPVPTSYNDSADTSGDAVVVAPTHPQVALPEAPALMIEPDKWYVTNGERKTWLGCQRKWMLESYLNLGKPTRKVTGPAATGTRFHRPLAAWYQPVPGDPWAVFEADAQADREYLDDIGAHDETKKDLETEIDLVRAMLEGYFEWVEETSSDVGLKIIAPETVIQTNPQFPEFPHVRLMAKLDVRVVDERDNARWFIDHKTVQGFDYAMKSLRGDEQMLHYHLIEWLNLIEEGLDTEIRAGGAYYNMARKVKRTAQANPPFFQREPVKHNVEELRSYWMRVKATVIQITRARAELDAGKPHQEVCPPNWTQDCSWKCEFFTVCPMMDDNPRGAQDYMREQLVQINPLARYEPEAVGETM